MDDVLHAENGMTISPQRGRPAKRCAICGSRPAASLYRVAESDPPGDQRQAWLMCAECAGAVRQEVERAALQTPLRVRIAVGIISTRRRPAPRHAIWREQFWEDVDDAALDRTLRTFVMVAFVVKMLSVVAIGVYLVLAR